MADQEQPRPSVNELPVIQAPKTQFKASAADEDMPDDAEATCQPSDTNAVS